MYIYVLIIIIGQTYGMGCRLLGRINFESGDSFTASSFMGMSCRLLSFPDPTHGPYERSTLGMMTIIIWCFL